METVTTTGSIITKIITSKDKIKCFAIERTLQETEGGKAILFGMFPTLGNHPGDIYSFDKTTKHLLDHMQELEMKTAIIVNLFSKICRGHKISARNLGVDEQNLQFIDELLQRKDIKEQKLIMAFGSSMSSSNACKETQKALFTLIDFYGLNDNVYQITTNGLSTSNQKAVHLLYLGIRHPNSKWRLEPYKITRDLLGEDYGRKTIDGKTKKTATSAKIVRKKEV